MRMAGSNLMPTASIIQPRTMSTQPEGGFCQGLCGFLEEDIKKDDEKWLESCLNGLDEDEDGYVNINKPSEYQSTAASFPMDHHDDPQRYEDHYMQDDNSMEYEQKSHNVIIPDDLLHLPFFDPGEGGSFNMLIDDDNDLKNTPTSNNQQDYDVNMTEVESFSENLTCEKGFHPYWKDNSIIAQSTYPLKKSPILRPYFDLNTRSFGIPKIFHKYRLGQDDSAPPFILELLQSDSLHQSLEFPHYESSLRRSKDDLDILYSLAPKDLDKGVLMDMIGMLEYYGKTNHNKKSNSSEINDIWFMDNNNQLVNSYDSCN